MIQHRTHPGSSCFWSLKAWCVADLRFVQNVRDVSVEIPNRHSVSYGTKRARSAAYSFAEIEPLNLSRSSFSSSSATLKPTKWRNSSRAC